MESLPDPNFKWLLLHSVARHMKTPHGLQCRVLQEPRLHTPHVVRLATLKVWCTIVRLTFFLSFTNALNIFLTT